MRYPLHPFWRLVLSPLALLYGLIAGIRNWLYDLGILTSHEFDIPVISVGNITVGGSGKTPHVEYLIRLLSRDYRVAVLSRGYKRRSKGFLAAGPESTVDDLGDESFQIYRKFPEVRVIVDGNRERALKKIEEEIKDIEVVIMDDAYQHRSVKPGLSILLIDYDLPLSKEWYLPAGRMRESRHEKKRADLVLFTKCPKTLKPIEERIRVKHFNPFPYQRVYFTRIIYGNPLPVFTCKEVQQTGKSIVIDKNTDILAVTGIANPDPYISYLKNQGRNVRLLDFPDHYRFRGKDIEKIGKIFGEMEADKKIILTTEKDAVRLTGFCTFDPPYAESWYYFPIEVAVLQTSEKEDFENQIIKYVRDHQKNHGVHQK